MNRDKLYPYIIPVIFIVTGAGGLASVWNIDIKWIAMPLGLISILFILFGLIVAGSIADRQYEQSLEENKDKQEYHSFPGIKKQKRIYYTVTTVTTLLTMSMIVTGSKVENYLNWKRFILELLVTGGLASTFFVWLYTKKARIQFDNIKWDDHVRTGIFLMPLMIVLHSSVWYNHLKSSPVLKTTTAIVTSDGRKYIHLKFDGQTQRFTFGYPFNESVKEGDTVLLTIQQGALGYAYASKAVLLK